MEERIQKIIAAREKISRRNAEKLIADGRVSVNGVIVNLGAKANVSYDHICIDGREIASDDNKKIYIALNKPTGYVTTMHDDKGRHIVSELVMDIPQRVYPIGRLDINSEGLLLMTNDGDFANMVMHPSFAKEKTYRVFVDGNVQAGVDLLKKPIELDGKLISKPLVKIIKDSENSGVLEITIHEGRNRQIRRMCSFAGLKVRKLVRIAIGPIKLGRLKTGTWRNLTYEEINKIRSI